MRRTGAEFARDLGATKPFVDHVVSVLARDGLPVDRTPDRFRDHERNIDLYSTLGVDLCVGYMRVQVSSRPDMHFRDPWAFTFPTAIARAADQKNEKKGRPHWIVLVSKVMGVVVIDVAATRRHWVQDWHVDKKGPHAGQRRLYDECPKRLLISESEWLKRLWVEMRRWFAEYGDGLGWEWPYPCA